MAETALDTSKIGIQTLSSTEALDLFDDVSTAKPEDVTDKTPEPKKDLKKPAPVATKKEDDTTPMGTFLEEDEPEDEDNAEETPEDAPEDDEQDDNSEEEEENVFPSLAKELLQMGVFTLDDDETELDIKGPQEFAERWELEAAKKASDKLEGFLQSKGQQALDWFDAVFNKGVSPKEYMQQYVALEDFSTIDLTDEGNQERVVREILKDQGFEKDDIDAEVLKLKNIGELEATSQRYHKALVKKQAAKIQESKTKAEAAERQKSTERENYRVTLSQLITTKLKEKEYDGIPLTPQVANEVFDSLYNHKYTLPNGELITQFDKDIIDLKSNPDLKLKVGLILNLLKKDPTLASIKKKSVSKQSDELFNTLATKKKTLAKKSLPAQPSTKFW